MGRKNIEKVSTKIKLKTKTSVAIAVGFLIIFALFSVVVSPMSKEEIVNKIIDGINGSSTLNLATLDSSYADSYKVTVSTNYQFFRIVSNPGGIDCDQDKSSNQSCEKSFPVGTRVILSVPRTLRGVTTWTGDCVVYENSNDGVCAIESLNEDKNIAVTFTPFPCTVNLSASKYAVEANEPFSLSWNTGNAVSCSSNRSPAGDGEWADGKNQTLRYRNYLISPFSNSEGGWFTYSLTCKNIAGDKCYNSVNVLVNEMPISKSECGTNERKFDALVNEWKGTFCKLGTQPPPPVFPPPGGSAIWNCDGGTSCTATRENLPLPISDSTSSDSTGSNQFNNWIEVSP